MDHRTDSLLDLPLSGDEHPVASCADLPEGAREPLDWTGAGFALTPPVERAPTIGPPVASDYGAVPAPVVVPKRRRWIVGSALLALTGTIAYWMWSGTLKHVALGVVRGESITLSTEAEGLIEEVFVDTGEHVRRGQLLLSLENHAWKSELARLQDELRTGQVEAQAELVERQWQQEVAQDGRLRAEAEYREALGRLRNEEAQLELLELMHTRLQRMKESGTASAEENDRVRLSQQGQAAKVAELRESVRDLAARVERAGQLMAQQQAQTSPQQARVEFLTSEIDRWERRIAQLQVHAPVDGVVLSRNHHPGEWIEKAEPLFTLLKDGTQEVVFYVPQSSARGFETLGAVAFHEESRGVSLQGRIVRVDPQLHTAPPSIETFYRRNEPLVAVHVAADPRGGVWPTLPMDGIVRLPWLETIQSPWFEKLKSLAAAPLTSPES